MIACYMKKVLLFIIILLSLQTNAQLLVSTPDFITESVTSTTIIADASKGNQKLLGNTADIYVHIGAITNLSPTGADWKYVSSVWGTADAKFKCVALGNNKWSYTIPTNLRSYFGITNANEKILKIAILFRDAAGANVLRNADGSDMYVNVYDNNIHVRIDTPLFQPTYAKNIEPINKKIGDTIFINGKSNQAANLSIYFNDTLLASANNNTKISAFKIINKVGNQRIYLNGNLNSTIDIDTAQFYVNGNQVIEDLPTGAVDGINYLAGDTSAILVLYAPNKKSINVVGDFNNWTVALSNAMKMTKDSTRFWIQLNGLTPGVEYAYQYIIDGALKVADYNAEKILDPSNDSYIPSTTYPNLKAYPTGKTTGIVSVLQTAKPKYNWKVNNFVRPNKSNLIIYELLIRDFVKKQNFNELRDSLDYFKRLGVNTIQLMPVAEFEGNNSWGYNTSFNFALDKYYGTELAFKEFVDSAHAKGIAVVLDIVMNHVFGSSPLAQMYWDGTNNIPAANNPWLNAAATHPFNVGNDMNHESAATKQLVSRVVKHWLTNYKIDGFRWDLSKGFTQKNNPNNVSAWGNYDASRIAIWKNIYDTMQKAAPNSYCILEHFADNNEEVELANYGMLLWGNANYNFNQSTMGYATDASINGAFANGRGWAKQNLVTYMESHDEERIMYRNLNYGNSNGSYNVRDTATALKRSELAAAFWALVPGPKTMWQFGELGYNYSINTCADLSINNNCRLSDKPIRWDYYTNANRKGLCDAYAKFFKLRNNPNYTNDFISNKYSVNASGLFKSVQINGDSIKLVIIGNFDLTPQTSSVSFPSDGIWYSVYSNKYQGVLNGTASITLQPGEYIVYANKNISTQVITDVIDVNMPVLDMATRLYPNPLKNTSVLEYSLPESGKVSIRAYTMQGQDAGVIFSGFQQKGPQKVSIFKNNLMNTPGVYLLSIQLNQKQKIQKILITN
jgi:1,4-alpha-glucan branching enzyme